MEIIIITPPISVRIVPAHTFLTTSSNGASGDVEIKK